MIKKLEQMRVNSRRIGLTDKAKYEAGALDMLDEACEWLMLHDSYSKSTEQLVRELRKAMEE